MWHRLTNRPRPETIRGVRRSWVAVVVLSALGAVVVGVAGAAVKPYYWTPAQADAALKQTAPGLQLPSGDSQAWVDSISACRGVSRAVEHRYISFRCVANIETSRQTATGSLPPLKSRKPLWVKVRRQGNGQPCASLAGLGSIPSGCLSASGTRSSSVARFDAWEAASQFVSVWRESHPVDGGHGQQLQEGQGGLRGYGAGYFTFSWRIVNVDTNPQQVLEQHSIILIFTGRWSKPRGGLCLGSGCPPTPGVLVKQVS